MPQKLRISTDYYAIIIEVLLHRSFKIIYICS